MRDPEIEWAVLKSVAGFMNNNGGTLLVGVADDRTVLGIEQDYPLLGRKQNIDGWELWLTDALTTTLGKTAATDVSLKLRRDRRSDGCPDRRRSRVAAGVRDLGAG